MFAEILFPQKVGKDKDTLTYRIPDGLRQTVEPGSIVEISLRNRKMRGVIARLHDLEPSYKTKEILEVAAKAPHLKPWQIDLLFWISDYYFCPLYKVLKLFFPTAITEKKKLLQWAPQVEEEHTPGEKLLLSDEQQQAVDAIIKDNGQTTLLHGITGSGKTEIYRRIAGKILAKDQQILILVPEITLTPQTFQNFQEEFGNRIAVLHSQLSAKQKEQHWYRIYHGEAKIIIGSRSALFAPFQNLGAIVIDEEHEPSYKQDQAPRYHARDVASKISELLNINLILGSATPSIESYYLAQQGTYNLVELKMRIQHHGPTKLPTVEIVDLREEIKKKNYSIFSEKLQELMALKLAQQEQIILFLNRRGAASAVICRECGYIEKCENCDVAMTYHKQLFVENSFLPAERLICHHCGTIKKVPTLCPKCESTFIRYIGLGTQKIEEVTHHTFPQARTIRADRDTVQRHGNFEKIYEDFKNHQADILIGTQMIGKGLHLPQVNLVGVVLADLSLTIPDFRSSERTFQILTQVAGRAGRRGSSGQVVIQTYLPGHYAIQAAAKHDFVGFFDQELKLRKEFQNPPFTKLIKITLVDTQPERCIQNAKKLFTLLNQEKGDTQEEPSSVTMYPAFIPKLQNKYRWNILITGSNPSKLLKQCIGKQPALFEENNLRIDVDPLSVT